MHVQRGLQYLVCVYVCVCVSVYFNSRPTGYEPAYKRYQGLKCTKGSKNKVADFAEMSAFVLERETGTSGDEAQPIN